jgi:hypothetical protein
MVLVGTGVAAAFLRKRRRPQRVDDSANHA